MSTAGRENETLDSFVVADLCGEAPFADGTFDLVYSNFVIEHMAAPAAAFAEWRRVLRDGGDVVLVTSNRANPVLAMAALFPGRLRVALKRRGAGAVERDVFPTAYRANTPDRLAALLGSAGFDPVSVDYVATLHRYGARLRPLDSILRAVERCLPTRDAPRSSRGIERSSSEHSAAPRARGGARDAARCVGR